MSAPPPEDSFSSTRVAVAQERQQQPSPSAAGPLHTRRKATFFSWRLLGGIFATLLVVGWIFIIVVLIREEKWQLVLVAWLLLYAAAHFCYWYFKKHHLLSLHAQFCGRARIESLTETGSLEKSFDAPPSYDDVLKSEPPPPAYYSVMVNKSPSSSPKKHPIFSSPFLPKVFGGTPPSSTPVSPRPSTSSSMAPSNFGPNELKIAQVIRNKSPARGKPLSNQLGMSSWKTYSTESGPSRPPPPPYSASFIDVESHCIVVPSVVPTMPTYDRMASARSVCRSIHQPDADVINEALNPIFAPIHSDIRRLPSSARSNTLLRTPIDNSITDSSSQRTLS